MGEGGVDGGEGDISDGLGGAAQATVTFASCSDLADRGRGTVY